MVKVIRPVFGRPCYECEEQVPMDRVRALEDAARAAGRAGISRMLCVSCQKQREVYERRARLSERRQDVTIIRG